MPVLGQGTNLPNSPGYLQVPTWNGSAWVPRQASGIKNSTTPEAFGALGNTPANDDAPAIEAAIAAMVAACIADGSYVCEVVFDAGKNYYANRAPRYNPTINGAASYANAQIALPHVPWDWRVPGAPKVPSGTYTGATPLVTLILRSQASQQASNTSFNQQPCSIITTPTTGASNATDGNGVPSVIGGPAMYNTNTTPPTQWSGINLIVDGLNVVSSANPRFCGLDLTGINTCELWSLHVTVPTQGYAAPTACTNKMAFGVRLPANQNGGKIRIGTLGVYGYYSGIAMSEHVIADNVMLYWNQVAICYDQPGSHESWFSQLQTSGNANLIAFVDRNTGVGQVPGVEMPFAVGMWGMEDMSSKIWDLNNQLKIEATIYNVPIGGATNLIPPMDGGANVRLTQLRQSRGSVTAPSVPATTVAYKNAFGRDAWVTVTGGTVTGIAIDGVSTGLTSGQFVVPNNRTITLTYSSAPTWAWWLF